MFIDRPVYCVHINREIHKYLDIPVNVQFHRIFHRVTTLSTVMPLYASHAQIIECFYQHAEFINELVELVRMGCFVSLSKYPSLNDFIDSRRRLYEWDKDSYPMYFDASLNALTSFPTHSQDDPNSTEALRKVYGTLYVDAAPPFEQKLALEERRVLERGAVEISRHAQNESGAITAAFFRRSPILRQSKLLDRLLAKLLPYQFTTIYCNVFDAFTPTGFPQFSFFEDERSVPYLDFEVNATVLTKLGLIEFTLDESDSGGHWWLTFRIHPNFYEFVKAKDELFYLLYDVSEYHNRSAAKMGLIAHLRRLRIKSIAKRETDPFVAAAELYRAAEELCRDSSSAQRRRMTMPDSASWRIKYLIMTATDIEDRALRVEFKARGFTAPIVQNLDKLSYVEYRRSDIGRVCHVRTSAGSSGSSGAFIMGKNAVDQLKPDYVISVGVCFGLREEDQALGDIVVSEYIHDYERVRVSVSRAEDRGPTREASPALLSRARASLAIWNGVPVHIGPIASGEKLVDHPAFRDALRKLSPAPIAGEMEAWGLSAVCHEARKQFIMVKGICDWGMNKTSNHQPIAATNACKFVFDALVVV
jgi:nucleoside phosphorylase